MDTFRYPFPYSSSAVCCKTCQDSFLHITGINNTVTPKYAEEIYYNHFIKWEINGVRIEKWADHNDKLLHTADPKYLWEKQITGRAFTSTVCSSFIEIAKIC